MSKADREKWNARYREGAYATRPYPSELLARWLPRFQVPEQPRALDLASGTGRNSKFLARQGWQVDAIDIADVALAELSAAAEAGGLAIRCIERDLEKDLDGLPGELGRECYQLAFMMRYANPALAEAVLPTLAPGGYLVVESHLLTDQDVIGPHSDRFRVAPGRLARAVAGLETLFYDEGIVLDPDGRPAALARVVARKPAACQARTIDPV